MLIMSIRGLQLLVATAALQISSSAFAGNLLPDVHYYGYFSLDLAPNNTAQIPITTAYNDIVSSTGGFSATNMNLVNDYASLNSSVCARQTCALSIDAGTRNPAHVNICPEAADSAGCTTGNNNQYPTAQKNISTIVSTIASGTNMPAAIYFIDEPFDAPALGINGSYSTGIYSSYLCTLRQAMASYHLSIPVFTALSYDEAQNPVYQNEIQNGSSQTGCTGPHMSTLDWVGVDNYYWSTANDSRTKYHDSSYAPDITDILNIYERVAPEAGTNQPKWVLFPPSTTDPNSTPLSDSQLYSRVNLYWQFLTTNPTTPVVAIVNYRFDPAVTLCGSNNPQCTDYYLNYYPNTVASYYPQTVALLSYMANTLTLPGSAESGALNSLNALLVVW